jgi:hypothetical protein
MDLLLLYRKVFVSPSDTVMKRNFLSYKNSMFSLKMITFCKSVNCPASQDLLAFQKGETSVKENADIVRHLESCEFCAAEVEFYSHFPQSEEKIASADIPLPLYQLAEALLGSSKKKFSLLNKLLSETDGLSLKKA